MNPPVIVSKPRRRVWPWILGLILTPVAALGLMVWSTLSLGREAARLRDELMTASGGAWETRIQLTLNPVLLAAARTAIGFVHDVPPEAHAALRAVRSVSVGVYERPARAAARGPHDWTEADRAMTARGWSRVVAVMEPDSTVLIYVPADTGAKPSRVCLAVCEGRQLVVVAGRIRPDAIADLVGRELGRHPLRL